MAKRKASLVVRMTDGADGVKAKSLTNINPDATLDELKTLAQGLVGLTDRSYVGATRIEQTDTSWNPSKYTPVSFWFGSTKLADSSNLPEMENLTGQYGIEFNVNQEGVVHEDGYYKFTIEVRHEDGRQIKTDFGDPSFAPPVFVAIYKKQPSLYLFPGTEVDFYENKTGAPLDTTSNTGGLYADVKLPDTFTQPTGSQPLCAVKFLVAPTEKTNGFMFGIVPKKG